jgi:hypothetical protein
LLHRWNDVYRRQQQQQQQLYHTTDALPAVERFEFLMFTALCGCECDGSIGRSVFTDIERQQIPSSVRELHSYLAVFSWASDCENWKLGQSNSLPAFARKFVERLKFRWSKRQRFYFYDPIAHALRWRNFHVA